MAVETIYEPIFGGGADVWLGVDSQTYYSVALGADYKRVSPITLTQAITFDAVLYQLYQSGSPASLRAVIYADNAGAPGALIAAGVDVVQPRTAGGPQALPFAAPVTLQPGTYWVGVNNGAGSHYPYKPVGTYERNPDTWIGGASDPFGTPEHRTDGAMPVGFAVARQVNLVGGTPSSLDPSWWYPSASYVLSTPDRMSFAGVYPFAEPTLVTHIAFVSPRASAARARFAIYADDGNLGRPGTLIAQTDEVVGQRVGVTLVPLSAPVTLPAGSYYIGAHSSADPLWFMGWGGASPYSVAFTGKFYGPDAYADGPANPAITALTLMTISPAFALVSGFSIASVSPGAELAGATVTIDGVGFEAGAVVRFGGVEAADVVLVSATQITCTAPAHAPGVVDVSVTVGPNTATLAGGFEFLPFILEEVSPGTGGPAGGVEVTITGRGFEDVGPAVLFGAAAALDVVVLDAERIVCLAPAHAPGVVDVQVTLDGNTRTAAGAFAYVDPFHLDEVAPALGHVAGGQAVELVGGGFEEGALVFFGSLAAASELVDEGLLRVVSPPAAAPGVVDVTVRLPDGSERTIAGGFTYEIVAVTSVEPTSVSPGGGTVAVFGRWFAGDAYVLLDGIPVPTSYVDEGELEITVPALESGLYDVQVVTRFVETATLEDGLLVAAPISTGRTVVFVVT